MSLCCYGVVFIESSLLISPEKALNRVSTTSNYRENTDNKLCNEALVVTSS